MDDGHSDDPPKEPSRLPVERPPRLASIVRPPPARDTRGAVGAQRDAFTRTYLGMLQEPDIVGHIRQLLETGTAKDIAMLLTPLARVLFPTEQGSSSPVQVNLIHGVPRPPHDVTPP